MILMSVTCDVFHRDMSALKEYPMLLNRPPMSVMSDVSQSPMSSVKDAVPGPALQYGLAAQHWTPLGTFEVQLVMA